MTTQPRNFPRFGGLKSKPRLEFPRVSPSNNKRQGTVLTFSADTTWIAPAWARLLPRVVGKGADGKPATGSHFYVDGYNVYQQDVTYIKSEGRYIYGNTFLNSTIQGSPVPSGFRNKNDEDDFFIYYQDFTFSYTQIDQGNYVGPTSGGASTGFSQVFAGGPSAEPAPITQFLNVSITPGVSYPIVVPLGGYITIEY